MGILENIKSPADVKKLSTEQLAELTKEIRGTILKTVAKNGGHLSSNLGIVEVTLALHKIFSAPEDKIIFDVSHQSYAHKLLTGRYERFTTLRKAEGISGFSNPEESEYDPLFEGHCGTSVSQALAYAVANSLNGNKNFAVAVVGDGALTNGMIYEALNNCTKSGLRLVVLLNDNEPSADKNADGQFNLSFRSKRALFESLGLEYFGPVDGNNLAATCSALAEAKNCGSCCVVHVCTKKGLGYLPAERDPLMYHAVSPFDIERGAESSSAETFSARFAKHISNLADTDKRICAITAAMGLGTGLNLFEKEHPERFFDVGIAEEHAVTFGAGLAAAGKLPVCAIYSTFSQRSYDQLFHDVALGNLHFVLALDRCGFVEGDGLTHQGIFDYSLFSSIPGVTIYSPATFKELETCLNAAVNGVGLQIVRYPKGSEGAKYGWKYSCGGDIAYTVDVQSCKTVIITYGKIALNALPCLGDGVGIIRLVKAFPFNLEGIDGLLSSAENIYFLEEGIYEGGMSQKLSCHFAAQGKKICVRAVRSFVSHGELADMFKSHGLSPGQIREEIQKVFQN